MREIVRLVSCDFCYDATDEKIPVEQTFTIGITIGEERPALYVAEVCAVHGKPLQDLMAQLRILQPLAVAKPSTAAPSTKTGANGKEYKTARATCGICGKEVSTTALANHIWGAHLHENRPVQPDRCPDCPHRANSSLALAAHRRLAHGYNAIAEAYALIEKRSEASA